jgi:hypothetical protein
MFTDELARQALQEVWPILAALVALFILAATIFYPLLGPRRPLARRVEDAVRPGELDAEEKGGR